MPKFAGGLATSVGSFPGTDSLAAARWSLLETPEFWTVPELPDRGPGSEMIGRTLGMLAGISDYFYAGLSPTGWELASGATRAITRAQSFLAEDFERVESVYISDPGVFSNAAKISVVGPLTLSASVGRSQAENLIVDVAAVFDVAQALGEVVHNLISEMRRRYSGVRDVVVQIDEPLLASVLGGGLKNRASTAPLRSWTRAEAVEVLAIVVAAAHAVEASVAFHGCTTTVEFDVMLRSRVDLMMCPMSLIRDSAFDRLAESFDAGVGAVFGIDVGGYGMSDVGLIMGDVLEKTRRIGIPDTEVAQYVSVSPECGLWNSANPGAQLQLLRWVSEELRSL